MRRSCAIAGTVGPDPYVGVRPAFVLTAEQGAQLVREALRKDARLANVRVAFDPDRATAMYEVVSKPFLQIRHTVPLEETDGEFIRIAVQVETTAGLVPRGNPGRNPPW